MSEEKLKDVLRAFLRVARPIQAKTDDGGQLHVVPLSMVELAKQALSEAGDEAEMVKLGKRLKELRARQRREAEAAHDRQAWVVSHDASTRAGVYSLVIELIEEFGYKLPEGEE